MQCAEIFSPTALPCMRGSAVGEKNFAHRNLHPNFFAQCRCQQRFFCLVHMNARKVRRTQLNAKKVAWCNYKQKMMPFTENTKGKSKGRTGKLSFANREGRPSTLRHSNSSFQSNISSVFEVLKRAIIFENISKLSLDRAKICSGEKVTHFFTDEKVFPSLTIFHLPFLSLQNTTRLKSGTTFTFFLLSLKTFFDWSNLLRKATLRILISWNLSFCVHSCSLCEKINAEFSVNIVWGNSRKATSASVSERS